MPGCTTASVREKKRPGSNDRARSTTSHVISRRPTVLCRRVPVPCELLHGLVHYLRAHGLERLFIGPLSYSKPSPESRDSYCSREHKGQNDSTDPSPEIGRQQEVPLADKRVVLFSIDYCHRFRRGIGSLRIFGSFPHVRLGLHQGVRRPLFRPMTFGSGSVDPALWLLHS